MGLDLVEFVMAVEHTYGIAIPDEDAQRMHTPRHVANWIHARLPQRRESIATCFTQKAFYVLRQKVCERLGVNRSTIRPITPLHRVLPATDGPQIWKEIGQTIDPTYWPRVHEFHPYNPFGASRLKTFGQVADRLATYSASVIKPKSEGWSMTEVELTLERIIKRELGIKAFTWDDRFVEDLGLD